MTDLALSGDFSLNSEMVSLIKDSIAKDATDTELALFIQQCNRTQLDPFAKQIYLVARWDSKLGREVRTTQVSIDGMRLVAQRSQQYAGQTATMWCGENGQWTDVWLAKTNPSAAKVGVYRDGFAEPLWAVATWDQYAVWLNKKGGEKYLSPFWSKMPALMLGKCAEALALRKSFPMELSGLYIPEEMGEDERPRKRAKRSTQAPALTGATVVRSAPVLESGTETPDEDLKATEDELNTIEERLQDLAPPQKSAVAEDWKELGLPPIASGQLTSQDVQVVLDLIEDVTKEVQGFAPEAERF